MRTKFLVCLLVAVAFTSSAFAAVVVEKRSRQMPYVEVFGCEGVHAFIFRGPKGTSRRPILVPPREFWTAPEAGIYSFVLRYQDGSVCSRLVTPEVFARYQVGDDFYASMEWSERTQTEDSKASQPVTHHQQRTAQARKHRHSSHRVAKHHRKPHRSHRIAQR